MRNENKPIRWSLFGILILLHVTTFAQVPNACKASETPGIRKNCLVSSVTSGGGQCEVNINCQEGDNWQKQKKGVVRIKGKKGANYYWGTGTLVNNTRQDNTPFILTAGTLGQNCTPDDLLQWVFYFGYEYPECTNSSSLPGNNTITGATFVASGGISPGSDFLLVRLNTSVPLSFDPYYVGWNRLDVASPSGVSIHQPKGDAKKISTYTVPLVSSSWYGNPELTHWKVVWAATQNGHGVTEAGSVGAPVFDKDGHLVGTLTGGESSCDAGALNLPDYYGKFSYSWDQNGATINRQLMPWLDPDNTGITVLDGEYVNTPEVSRNKQFELWPNPCSDYFVLSTEYVFRSVIYIEIADMFGRIVRSQAEHASGITFPVRVDVSGLGKGLYLVKVHDNSVAYCGRLIINEY